MRLHAYRLFCEGYHCRLRQRCDRSDSIAQVSETKWQSTIKERIEGHIGIDRFREVNLFSVLNQVGIILRVLATFLSWHSLCLSNILCLSEACVL